MESMNLPFPSLNIGPALLHLRLLLHSLFCFVAFTEDTVDTGIDRQSLAKVSLTLKQHVHGIHT